MVIKRNPGFILHPFLCCRLPLLLLASFGFSTEDSHRRQSCPRGQRQSCPRGQTLLVCSPLSLVAFCSTQPVFSCLKYTFALLSPLSSLLHPLYRRVRAIPHEDSWFLLVPLEPECSSACTLEEGRSRYCRPLLPTLLVAVLPRVARVELALQPSPCW
jgi:hypothetical protein